MRTKIPFGVTVVAALIFCGAALLAIGCVAFFVFGHVAVTFGGQGPMSSLLAGMGAGGAAFFLILAGAYSILASFLLKMRVWARRVTIYFVATGLVFAAIGIVQSLGKHVPAVLAWQVLVVIVQVGIIWYLSRERTAQIFAASSPEKTESESQRPPTPPRETSHSAGFAELKTGSYRNILFATDFSSFSDTAARFVVDIAKGWESNVYALNIFAPSVHVYFTPYELTVEALESESQHVREMMRTELQGLPHEAIVDFDASIWSAVDRAIKEHEIDLIVLGTHGRVGADKFVHGSVAEEISRRSTVPVLIIGPRVRTAMPADGRFERILCATDLSEASKRAAACAVDLAERNQSRLVMFHAARQAKHPADSRDGQKDREANESNKLVHDAFPSHAAKRGAPEIQVAFGEPAKRIVETADERGTDLIVMGVHDARKRIGEVTHLECGTAYRVIAHASCPVLTVRA
jgi:nucleotide-binding universal stress UspA family protein